MAESNRQLVHEEHRAGRECFPLILLLDGICDGANVGAIFRLADALGVERLLLCGNTVSPPNRRLTRTARSADKVVLHERCDDLNATLMHLREQGYCFVALELTAQSVDLKDVDFGRAGKICLILGAEQQGVSQPLLEIADQTVHIPMLGQNSSMNVAAACAIAVYEITGDLRRSIRPASLASNIEGANEKTQK
ncbi:MAG TPA: RNA methyltransferase [Chromatiales bacterium]|nr:RNA methyltransferase [Chromatiales bacterium]